MPPARYDCGEASPAGKREGGSHSACTVLEYAGKGAFSKTA